MVYQFNALFLFITYFTDAFSVSSSTIYALQTMGYEIGILRDIYHNINNDNKASRRI